MNVDRPVSREAGSGPSTPSSLGRRPFAAALAPAIPEILALAGLSLFYLVAYELFGHDSYLGANLAGPLMLTAVLGLGAWRMVRADGKNLWTALFWFRISTAVYFGLGTYVVFLMDNVTRLYVETMHQFFNDEVFKLNQIVAFSVMLVLSAARMTVLARTKSRRHASVASAATAPGDMAKLKVAGVLFLAVGMVVTYTIKIPYDFGWTTYEWPGSILNLSRMTLIGIFMLTLWSLECARRWLPAVLAIAGLDMLAQLLLFAKSGIMMTLIMVVLAFLWSRLTLWRGLTAGVLMITAFAILQPIVAHARIELESKYGADAQVGFAQRYTILISYFDAATAMKTEEEVQGWTRISYVNAATFVIRQYDIGQPGNWPSLLPAVFVPRFLWPEKPIISDVGRDLFEMQTGKRTSSVGTGVLVDAYWAMGWWGVVVYVPIYGVILGLLTVMTSRLLREGRWLHFPVVLMALQMGFRADGNYVTDVAGATVILVGMYAVLSVIDGFLQFSPDKRGEWRARQPLPRRPGS